MTAIGLITVSHLLLFALLYRFTHAISALTDTARKRYSNPLVQLMYAKQQNEIGEIELALRMNEARNKTVLTRLSDISYTIKDSIDITESAIQKTDTGIGQQEQESDMVAAAMHQVAGASQEIAQNISDVSEASQSTLSIAQEGRSALKDTVKNLNNLSDEVANASDTTAELKQYTDTIGNIVSVIKDIAEQTNLLALNAAIEAARAGETGRGFAVVADEVRTLATRTQNSTQEIETSIANVQNAVEQTVSIMGQSRNHAENSVAVAESADNAFKEVQTSVGNISERCEQIAVSSEEQSSVVEDVHKCVMTIRDLAQQNREASNETSNASHELHQLVKQLDSMVSAFDR